MRMRLSPIALAATLVLALMVFAACDLGGEDETTAAPPAPSQPAPAVEPAPPSEPAPADESAPPSAAPGVAEPAPRSEPLSVVASIYPLGYFAERIGGELVTVDVLVSPGFENHGFVPTASDLRSLEAADLIVMNGLELEPWMERALATLSDDPDRIVVEAADESRAIEGFAHGDEEDDHAHEGEDDHADEEDDDHAHDDDDHGHEEDDHADEEDDDHAHDDDDDHGHEEDDHADEEDDDHGHEEEDGHGHDEDDDHEDEDDHAHEMDEHGHDHGELDPHMWLDPELAAVQVERIRDALIELDPGNADTYRANTSALAGELEALDSEIAAGLGVCQHDHFVTSHAAYGYLAARYGIEQIPVAGLSPEVEPSPRELAEISDQIAELGLKYVMVEPVLSDQLTQALAREHDIELIAIHAIESVTQAELDAHNDYFGLMRDNLANLVLALDCA